MAAIAVCSFWCFLSLLLQTKHPVRLADAFLFPRPLPQVTDNLVQEFIRIRPAMEPMREAIVLSLCKRVYKERCLVFVRTKKHAHRLRIIFGLANLSAAELHGSLSQVKQGFDAGLHMTRPHPFFKRAMP